MISTSFPGQSLTGATLLTIDDDAIVRDSIVSYLEDSGFTVLSAASGAEGLRLFREHRPAVVVCDLRMPDLDGLRVLATLTEESPSTPIIVMSGAGVMHDVVEALRLGACDYLVKPILDLAVLEHAIRAALRRVHLEQENARYQEELELANRELASHLAVLRADHEAGRRAQIQLLPEPESRFGAYHFSHTILPSLYLSGDFLDYFEIDERYIGLYLADVSGHGAASAFVTMMLKSLMNQPLRGYRRRGETLILEPAALLEWLNTEVLQANLGKYLTLFYAVLDRQEHRLHFANAGHFPRPVTAVNGQIATLAAEGFPIGLFGWSQYQAEQLSIAPGFAMGLFSDGLMELLGDGCLASKQARLEGLMLTEPLSIDGLRGMLRLTERATPSDDVSLFLIQRM